MSFSRLIQWYHSHADPIWPDGTFKYECLVFYASMCLFVRSTQLAEICHLVLQDTKLLFSQRILNISGYR